MRDSILVTESAVVCKTDIRSKELKRSRSKQGIRRKTIGSCTVTHPAHSIVPKVGVIQNIHSCLQQPLLENKTCRTIRAIEPCIPAEATTSDQGERRDYGAIQ